MIVGTAIKIGWDSAPHLPVESAGKLALSKFTRPTVQHVTSTTPAIASESEDRKR